MGKKELRKLKSIETTIRYLKQRIYKTAINSSNPQFKKMLMDIRKCLTVIEIKIEEYHEMEGRKNNDS